MCENCLCEEGDRRREERKLATFKCCCPWVWRETGLPSPFFLGSLSISKCYAFYLLHNLLLFLPLTTFKNSYLPQRRRLQSQNPPITPLNRGWSRAKAKTCHFPLLDLGLEEGEEYNFAVHYVQDCRSVQDDSKSLWFSYVKGCYYTHKHKTSPFFFADLHMMMYKDWLLSQKQQMLDRMEHLSWPWFFAAKDLTLQKKTKNILSSSPNE